jgi:hypothetical protein
MQAVKVSVLSKEEIAQLIKAFGGNGEPFTSTQIQAFIQWVQDVRIYATIVRMLLDGELVAHFVDKNTTDPEHLIFTPRSQIPVVQTDEGGTHE